MNKQVLFKICLVAALSACASYAFAAGTTISGTTILGGGTYSPSKSVKVICNSTTTAYAATSGHLSGDRTIGTNNANPKIFYTSKAISADPSAPGSTSEPFTGWSSL